MGTFHKCFPLMARGLRTWRSLVKVRTCCAGLADADGTESAPQSASALDGADTGGGGWDGWKQPDTSMGLPWGQDDEDGIQWEDTDNAENVEPGRHHFFKIIHTVSCIPVWVGCRPWP